MIDHKMMTFLKVIECRNYTKAAKELNMTQPAVTQHIKKLEEYYGAQLIEILGKSIHLTDQGRIFYNYASFQVANEKQLIDQLQKNAPPLKIGATLSIADYYLPAYLTSYMAKQKDLLSIQVMNTQSIIDRLLKNDLNCAFIEGIFDKSLFQHEEFIKTRFLAIARKGHPLANKIAGLKDIHSYPLLIREIGSGTREIYENFLYQNNDSLHSTIEVQELASFTLIKNLLENSDAISFMYEKVAKKEIDQGRLLSLTVKNFSIERPLYFVYPKHSILKNKIEKFYDDFILSES